MSLITSIRNDIKAAFRNDPAATNILEVLFAYPGFHQDFLRDHALVVACPKLDDFQAHLTKLTQVLKQSSVKSLKVVHMEVPCCSGLVHMVKQAIQLSGKDIPIEEVTIGIKGEILAPA